MQEVICLLDLKFIGLRPRSRDHDAIIAINASINADSIHLELEIICIAGCHPWTKINAHLNFKFPVQYRMFDQKISIASALNFRSGN